jgi:hypothetical protein
MEDNPKISPLYQATLRLVSRVSGARESLQHLTHLAAAEGRVDLALSLRAVGDALDQGEMETIGVLRGLDKQAEGRPHRTPAGSATDSGKGPPK